MLTKFNMWNSQHVNRDIDSSATKALQPIRMLQAALLFFLLFLVWRGWCVLSCGLIGFCFILCNPAVKHLSNSSFTGDNGIHITSAHVYCNNINFHSGYYEQKKHSKST